MKTVLLFSKVAFNTISAILVPKLLFWFGLTKSFGKYSMAIIFWPYFEKRIEFRKEISLCWPTILFDSYP